MRALVYGLFFLLSSSSAAAREPVDDANIRDLINKDVIVLALKVGGRLECGTYKALLAEHSIASSDCSNQQVEDNLASFNESVNEEQFIVLRPIKGDVEGGQLLTVPYPSNPGPEVLGLGEAGLLFLAELKDGRDIVSYRYDGCEIFYFDRLKGYFSSTTTVNLDDLIKYLQKMKLSSCDSEIEP